MKKYFIFHLLCVALFSGKVLSQDTKGAIWGPITNGLQMSISFKGNKQEVLLGQPILLKAMVRNVSGNKTYFIHECYQKVLDGSYAFIISSPSGMDISPKIKEMTGGSGGFYSIAPGQAHEVELNLSPVCKFEAVGKYKITTVKSIKDYSSYFSPGSSKQVNSQFKIVSNTLYINVIQY